MKSASGEPWRNSFPTVVPTKSASRFLTFCVTYESKIGKVNPITNNTKLCWEMLPTIQRLCYTGDGPLRGACKMLVTLCCQYVAYVLNRTSNETHTFLVKHPTVFYAECDLYILSTKWCISSIMAPNTSPLNPLKPQVVVLASPKLLDILLLS